MIQLNVVTKDLAIKLSSVNFIVGSEKVYTSEGVAVCTEDVIGKRYYLNGQMEGIYEAPVIPLARKFLTLEFGVVITTDYSVNLKKYFWKYLLKNSLSWKTSEELYDEEDSALNACMIDFMNKTF